MTLEKMIELAKKIKDEKLREKTIEMLKDIKLTHPSFSKYPREDPEKVRTPFIVNDVISIRELTNHTVAVTKACLELAKVIEESYGIKVNYDVLIAGSLLHDIMKVYEFKDGQPTGILLDHSALGLAELYKREFPEEVLHLVISHLAPSTNPPKTIEAVILHYADTLMALIEFSSSQNLIKEESKK